MVSEVGFFSMTCSEEACSEGKALDYPEVRDLLSSIQREWWKGGNFGGDYLGSGVV